MAHVRINETVWCNTGKPSSELDGSFVGKVLVIKEDNYSVMEENNLYGIRTYIANITQLKTLYPQPIDSIRKILHEVMNCKFNEDDNIEWVCKSNNDLKGINEANVIKYWTNGDYELVLKKYTKDRKIFKLAINRFNQHFNCNPNSHIVAKYSINGDGTLRVHFFHLNNTDKIESNVITMTDGLKNAMSAINKFMSFGMNFKTRTYTYIQCGICVVKQLPTFIIDAKWTCGIDDIIGFWEMAVKCRRPSSYITNFYELISPPDRQALIEWVMLNYEGEEESIFCE